MINKILGTILSRFSNALLSLGIIIIISRQLGAEAVGTISLIILGITIVQLVNNFVGGSALIYLVPRFDIYKLIVLSYIWAFITAFICSFILKIFNLIPTEFFKHVLFLSLIQSLTSVNMSVLLGKEKVKQFNIISFLQIFTLITILSILIFYLGKKEVLSYIIALYASYLLSLSLSFVSVLKFVFISNLKNLGELIKNIFKYGTYVQFANIIQLFNYRLSYYFIENFIGRAALGIYSVGVQLSEGLWLTGKSLAIVQYSKISNTENKEYSKKITLVFGKISVLITFFLLIILLIIPTDLFSRIFGKDFGDLPVIILSLSTGIIFLSLSFAFTHYFSGTGKHYHNSISSFIGFVFTLILSYFLIPEYKLIGAGIASSIAYFSILIYQIIFFIKISDTKIKELYISVSDIRMFLSELKKWLKNY